MHIAITGASSGIGEALAREWSAAGAKVTLVARRKALLEKLAGELPGPKNVFAHDLADPARATEWLAPAEAALGPIDVLVNNAGVQVVEATSLLDADKADLQLRVNLLSPLRLLRAVLPAMLARGAGTIVNVASVAALAPTPGMTWYSASKGGLAAASEGLRGELRGSGVNVVTVYPGPVESDMGRSGLAAYKTGIALSLSPWGTPDVLARRVRAAVEKRRARVIYPRVYSLTRWFPGTTRFILDRFTPPLAAAQEVAVVAPPAR